MSISTFKKPLGRALNALAEQRVRDVLETTGLALPCTVLSVQDYFVTVNFDVTESLGLTQVSCPISMWNYVRVPVQPGDKGMVIAADAYLDVATGLNGGAASDLTPPGNLSALVFIPICNKSQTPNNGMLVLMGPNGVDIKDQNGNSLIHITPTGITINWPVAVPLILNGNVQVNGNLMLSGSIQGAAGGSYASDIKTSGDVIANVGPSQVGLKTHKHAGVTTGTGTSASPTPGT